MNTPVRLRGGLWRQRNFALFWAGESISEVGNSVCLVVVPLVAIDLLHTSTLVVTLLNAVAWLPWLIIGVPAGAWVDRLPPRLVMLACDAVSAACYLSVPVAAWCDVLTVGQLIAITLIAGAATVFFRSAYQVMLAGILEQADLTEGNAKLMGSREVAQIGGPGLGGLLAQLWGPVTGLLADAISFAVSFACLTAVPRPRNGQSGSTARTGILRGLRFVWHDPYLRVTTAFSATANLALTGVSALTIVFLVRTLGQSSGITGLVMAIGGIGGVLGAVTARPLGRRFGSARVMLIADIAGLAFALLIPLTHAGAGLVFIVVANVFIGGGVTIANVMGASFRQTYVPADMLGRVSSATMTIAYAMMPVGALLAGTLATALGVRTALWILTALISASGLIFLPSPLGHLRDFPQRPERPARTAPDEDTRAASEGKQGMETVRPARSRDGDD
jgi:MFS family permease